MIVSNVNSKCGAIVISSELESRLQFAEELTELLNWQKLEGTRSLTDMSAKELREFWPSEFDFIFNVFDTHSGIYGNISESILFVPLDFNSTKVQHRLKSTFKSDPLVKALGRDFTESRVLDLTAGFGRDSLVLAKFCKSVIAVERNPVVFMLLKDAFNNYSKCSVEVIHSDSLDFLNENLDSSDGFDMIFLDPMFPESRKSALPSKEMQVLRALLGHQTDDFEKLFEKSLEIARKRVLVKRSLKSEAIKARPDSVYEGKSFRIDVYLTRN